LRFFSKYFGEKNWFLPIYENEIIPVYLWIESLTQEKSLKKYPSLKNQIFMIKIKPKYTLAILEDSSLLLGGKILCRVVICCDIATKLMRRDSRSIKMVIPVLQLTPILGKSEQEFSDYLYTPPAHRTPVPMSK
jgi:hypothetical protein